MDRYTSFNRYSYDPRETESLYTADVGSAVDSTLKPPAESIVLATEEAPSISSTSQLDVSKSLPSKAEYRRTSVDSDTEYIDKEEEYSESRQRKERLRQWGLKSRQQSFETNASVLEDLIDAHAADPSVVNADAYSSERPFSSTSRNSDLPLSPGGTSSIMLDTRLPLPLDYQSNSSARGSSETNRKETAEKSFPPIEEVHEPDSESEQNANSPVLDNDKFKELKSQHSQASILSNLSAQRNRSTAPTTTNPPLILQLPLQPISEERSTPGLQSPEPEIQPQPKSWFQRLLHGWWGAPKPEPTPPTEPTLESMLVQHSAHSRRPSRNEKSDMRDPSIHATYSTVQSAIVRKQGSQRNSLDYRGVEGSRNIDLRRGGVCSLCDGTQFLEDGRICPNCGDLPPTLYISDSFESESVQVNNNENKSRLTQTLKRFSNALSLKWSGSTSNLHPPSPATSNASIQSIFRSKSIDLRSKNSRELSGRKSADPISAIKGRSRQKDDEGGVTLRRRIGNALRLNRRHSVVIRNNASSASSIANSELPEGWERTMTSPSPTPSHYSLDPGPASPWMQEADINTQSRSLRSRNGSRSSSLGRSPSTRNIETPLPSNLKNEAKFRDSAATVTTLDAVVDDWDGSRSSLLDSELQNLYRDLVYTDLPLGALADKYMTLREKRHSVDQQGKSVLPPVKSEVKADILNPMANIHKDEARWSASAVGMAWIAANVSEIGEYIGPTAK